MVDEVQVWVNKIGFREHLKAFAQNKVNGDLLLRLTEKELEHDLGIASGILRKTFLQELDGLKIAADYSSIDPTHLDSFLLRLLPELGVYTYALLSAGINRNLLPTLNDEIMTSIGINNAVHRMKLNQALQGGKSFNDVESALLREKMDTFISYRHFGGCGVALFIKEKLEAKGFKVFVDVNGLGDGPFGDQLLKNVQAAKHFIFLVTKKLFERINDDQDWIRKEMICALQHKKNIVPVFDDATFPEDLPEDIRAITSYNGVQWLPDHWEESIKNI
ncbi:hypothetical protein PMAYCL1PPCAC_20305, partial [Pristionchus mayeri]